MLIYIVSNGLWTSLVAPFRGASGSAKFTNHVKIAMLRTFLKQTTVRQLQAITPTVEESYTALAKQKGFAPESVTCADGTKAFWIGSTKAEKVVIWYHGGGYCVPPDPGHLSFFHSVVESAGGKIALLVPEYTLAPYATYPHQLRQGVEVVRHVCKALKRDPQNIIIAGDSAGANLAMGVLSHMLHPHPEIPPLELHQPLGAAILLAPWASFRNDWPSTNYNAHKDMVSAHLGNKWSATFLGGKEKDGYNEPMSAPEGWFEGLDEVVSEVLVLGGSDEMLVDSIRAIAKVLEGVHSRVTTVIAEGEWHDRPINSALGRGGELSEVVKAFVKSRL